VIHPLLKNPLINWQNLALQQTDYITPFKARTHTKNCAGYKIARNGATTYSLKKLKVYWNRIYIQQKQIKTFFKTKNNLQLVDFIK